MVEISRVNIRLPKRIHDWYRKQAENGLTMQGHMWVALEQYMLQREALEHAKDFKALFEQVNEGLSRLEKKLDEAVSGRREPGEAKP